MFVDALVVPMGAEYAAVRRGWQRPLPSTVLPVPAGAASAAAAGELPPSVRCVLVLGVCGALDPALRVGDAVIYAEIIEGPATIELDAALSEACARRLKRPQVRAASVTAVVGAVAAKAALRARTGAAAIDMEAAPLARALNARGIRVAMVRIVSDGAAAALPDLHDVYTSQGKLRPLALARALTRRPLLGIGFVSGVLRGLGALRAAAHTLSLTA